MAICWILYLSIINTGGPFFSFQWDQPYASAGSSTGSGSDLDIYLFDQFGTTINSSALENVVTEIGRIPATRFAYSGDLQNEVWYDDAGRWVKMRFKGRDGSTIEYVCRRCQGGPRGKAAR